MSIPTQEAVELVVRTMAETAVAKEKEFGDLDAVVGDGDFGYSLARGFEIVLAEWDNLDRSSPAAFLQKCAIIITSRVGGTSGPIWGTAFMRAAGSVRGKSELVPDDVIGMLRAAIEGIKQRGDSDVGDKTLLDCLVPATDALETQVAKGATGAECLAVMASTARSSADGTVTMMAKRGRAAYTGERSIGSPDPGAIGVATMIEAIAEAWPAH